MSIIFDGISPFAKPDAVLREEAVLRADYLQHKNDLIIHAMMNAYKNGLLVTGFKSVHDEATGNELIYLIKWKRYNEKTNNRTCI